MRPEPLREAKPLPAILFDLDGTLCDPVLGITGCVQYALRKMGEKIPAAGQLHWMIGPQLRESFVTVVGEERADEALRLYRERFSIEGLYENAVYPGVEAMLAGFADEGYRLFVATSKAQIYAEQIISHFGLAPFFERVYGAELDGVRAGKAELISYLLGQEDIAPGRAIMVGDRRHDIMGARAAGIFAIGAGWGYGSADELAAARPVAVAQSPAEVLGCVRALEGA